MSGSRIAAGRVVGLGVLLALSLLLLGASRASAGRYAVAQCGWYVGADTSWADTTGGVKFRPDAYCVPPAGADPFDGAHLKSFTRDGQTTVTGTRFARWRWTPPPGTGITQVRGTWWHALHDGFEQRLGAVNWSGGFEPFAAAAATDVTPREFVRGFPAPVAAFEDRLLCARGESKWCSLDPGSWSALRALTITVEDPAPPAASILGGSLPTPGWHRGPQTVVVGAADGGAGVRFSETTLDGARVGLTEYACAKALIGGEWRATAMQPCPVNGSATATVATTSFSDGPHALAHCVTDFAGNGACAAPQTVLIDNNPPAHPRAPQLLGGDEWRRVNNFDLEWTNPEQGAASPIAGAAWRLVGTAGYDTGVRFAGGRDRKSLADLSVPAAGTYALQLWLRDEAGNEAPPSAVTIPLRFDDLAPSVAFAAEAPEGKVAATVADAHSGAADGAIFYRRLDAQAWTELPTKLVPEAGAGAAVLLAPLPDLGFGTYVFRADANDAAGNAASTTLRSDGTQMAIRRLPPPHLQQAKTRLFARLGGGAGPGDSMTIGYGAPARLAGRLTMADGAGIANRELRVVSRPSHGALVPIVVRTTRTGEDGGFELRLPPGTSRRVTVAFAGEEGLEPARRPGLELRVRSGVTLRARPLDLRTGEVLRLRGRVARGGAPLPRRGKLVAIQYLEEATHRWRPVLVTRSDHDGRFHARYRFRYVSDRAAIRLRATALAEERWPYAPGSSAPLTVRVRG
ncbi:MAG TPA: carboxypeptidase-like regulatory domain-containing protein [Solirubrobacterales bacterium]|nr:carboxypeptidase-like regulatory domain-containing protein [Solirubrobacterales bacterium]